jgi:HK97 family phage prohead protease
VLGLANHDPDKLLARTSNGSMSLSTDSRGLRFEMRMLPTTLAKDVAMCIRGGLLTSCSFGFRMGPNSRDAWSRAGNDFIRELIQVGELGDVSIVYSPAYEEAKLIRSLHPDLQKAFDRLRLLELKR